MMIAFVVFVCIIYQAVAFSSTHSMTLIKSQKRIENGVRSMKSVLDIIAGLSIASQWDSSLMHNRISSSSMNVAVVETRQGLYKEYSVEKIDQAALDDFKRNYKTAEETDDSKNKYWAILGVLVAGSFIIPMAQYYWYVADEDN